jgi:hypothetical protein
MTIELELSTNNGRRGPCHQTTLIVVFMIGGLIVAQFGTWTNRLSNVLETYTTTTTTTTSSWSGGAVGGGTGWFESTNTNTNTEVQDDPSPPVPPFTWNEQGCIEWPKPKKEEFNDPTTTTTTTTTTQPQRRPTGMAVTLARRADKRGAPGTLGLLCNKIPTQQAYFFEPHGLDLMIVLDIYGVTIHQVADCLELVDSHEPPQNWTNLDGSTIVTHRFQSKTGRGDVYLVPYDDMPYPEYIQRNMSLLDEPMWDCPTAHDYIQGTRYYSDQFLHLSILQEYDYMIKIDLDIEFKEALSFNILWDMKQRGAVMGHTGEFPKGLNACNKGIQPVMESFVRKYAQNQNPPHSNTTTTTTTSWNRHWKGPCSKGVHAFERGMDQWYTNLVVMDRAFFQSEPVRVYGRWMNEANPGLFKYRWSDQLFFHIAMGMFLGPE